VADCNWRGECREGQWENWRKSRKSTGGGGMLCRMVDECDGALGNYCTCHLCVHCSHELATLSCCRLTCTHVCELGRVVS